MRSCRGCLDVVRQGGLKMRDWCGLADYIPGHAHGAAPLPAG